MSRCVATKGERRCMLVAHGDDTPHWAYGEYWGGRCARCGRPAEEAHEACRQVPEGEPVAEAAADDSLNRALSVVNASIDALESWMDLDPNATRDAAPLFVAVDDALRAAGFIGDGFGGKKREAIRSRVAPPVERDGEADFARGFGDAIARVRAELYRDVVMPLDVFKECDKMRSRLEEAEWLLSRLIRAVLSPRVPVAGLPDRPSGDALLAVVDARKWLDARKGTTP